MYEITEVVLSVVEKMKSYCASISLTFALKHHQNTFNAVGHLTVTYRLIKVDVCMREHV